MSGTIKDRFVIWYLHPLIDYRFVLFEEVSFTIASFGLSSLVELPNWSGLLRPLAWMDDDDGGRGRSAALDKRTHELTRLLNHHISSLRQISWRASLNLHLASDPNIYLNYWYSWCLRFDNDFNHPVEWNHKKNQQKQQQWKEEKEQILMTISQVN